MTRLIIAALLVTLIVGAARIVAGGEKSRPKEAVDKAQRVVSEQLDKIKGRHGQIVYLDDPSLAGSFPDDVFFAVRYRQFPVARQLPEGLRASNVFVVRKDGKLVHVKDNRALERYFNDNEKPVKDADRAGTALAAWLILTQEAHQDGFFKFEVNKKNFTVDKDGDAIKAIGRALVMQGGNGEINATLRFEGG